MIVCYSSIWDTLLIYYYREDGRLMNITVYENGSSAEGPSVFSTLAFVRKWYRDEIIHDDNIN